MKRARIRSIGIPAATIGAALTANVAQWFVAAAHAADATGAPAAASAPGSGTPPAPTPAPPPGRDTRAALAALDTEIIQQRVEPGGKTRDAFAVKSWVVPPKRPRPAPVAPPPPPPPPQAPPLPFKYMGMLRESAERTVWYLLQGDRLIVAATNEVIASTYRVDGLEGGQLRFTYLPLDQRQSLAIGGSQ